ARHRRPHDRHAGGNRVMCSGIRQNSGHARNSGEFRYVQEDPAMTTDEILFDAEERMEKALDVFRDQLRGLRTGRATPALVDNLRIEYYGSPTPLKQLAQ